MTSPDSNEQGRFALRTRAVVGLALCLAVGAPSGARAADLLNSNDIPVNADQPASGKGRNAPHDELNVVPVAGGDTDVGFGGGFFAGFTRLAPGATPYVWNVAVVGLITFKPDEGGVAVPYQDLVVKLTVPSLFGQALRLELASSYTAEKNLRYYGLGDASPRAGPAGKPDSYTLYGRTHPQLDVDLRLRIIDHLSARVGARWVQNWIQAATDSSLLAAMSGGSSLERRLLGSAGPHAVVLLKVGLHWDTRDNETSSHEGARCSLDLRVSPGGVEWAPYRYGESTLNLRLFVPLVRPQLTLALRLVGHALFGDVPFYELARFDDHPALGGTNAVRGVPAGRYYGKLKVLGNAELRGELIAFHALGKPLLFGAVAFFDGGRVWTELAAHPDLDGSSLGIHWGAGGGLRLQSGSAFVLRADLAWSPDANSVGGYFSAG